MPRSDNAKLMDFVKFRGVVAVSRRSVVLHVSGCSLQDELQAVSPGVYMGGLPDLNS